MLRRLVIAALVAAPLMTAHAEPHGKVAHIVATGGRMTKLVEFEFSKLRIYSKDREELSEIAHMCRANPSVKLVVEGHAYAHDEEITISLGEKRAELVRSLLVRYGVEPDRITAVDASREGERGRYVDLVIER